MPEGVENQTRSLEDDKTVRETMDEQKARLLGELEELTEKEEEMKREEELRDLERQVETVRKRIREREAETASKKARVASQGPEKELQSSPSTGDASTACSHSRTEFDNSNPSTSQTTAGHSPGYNSHGPPCDSVVPAGSFEDLANSYHHRVAGAMSADCVRKFETLKYYKDLDGGADAELCSLNDMDIDQLRRLAANGEGAEGHIEQTQSIDHVCYSIFLKTGVVEDLERAIESAQEQIPVNIDDPDYARRLKNLIVMQAKKCQHTKSPDDLQKAIFRAQEMMATTPLDHPDRSARMSDWIGMMFMKFDHTKSQNDLDEAIISAREAGAAVSVDESDGGLKIEIPMYIQALVHDPKRAVELPETTTAMTAHHIAETPDGHPDVVTRLSNLGAYLGDRYTRTGELGDLQEAINLGRRAVAETSDGHPDVVTRLSNLGSYLRYWYERTGELGDLQEAIELGRRAVAKTPDDHLNLAARLSNLGIWLESRYQRTGKLEDLREAIKLGRRAVAKTPEGYSDLAACLSNLGGRLERRYERIGKLEDLQEAIELGRRAVAEAPEGYSGLAACLSNLGGRLGRRYERTGELGDLQEAIELGRRAVAEAPEGYSDLAACLSNLGNHFGDRYERTGELGDLQKAIELGRRAVTKSPEGHLGLTVWLTSLGSHLERRYVRTGELRDLQEAIELGRRAVAKTPESHSDFAAWLCSLGTRLGRRYMITGELQDLQEAIELERRAVAKAPEGYSGLAAWLSNLGSHLVYQYKRTGELRDLQEAIELGRRAVAKTPESHLDFAAWLSNLGLYLGDRYERTGELRDLQEAIELGQRAVAKTPESHLDLAARLSSLGNRFESWYKRTGELEDLQEAIELGRRAVAKTPESHLDFAAWLSNLGGCLESRYQRTGELGDLQEAIKLGRRAVAKAPEGYSDLAACLSNLGICLRDQYERTGELGDLQEAITIFQQALGHFTGLPLVRITAGRNAARMLVLQGNFHEAAKVLQRVVELLPKVTLRSKSRDDLQNTLSTLSGLASFTASVYLKAGKSTIEALQVLEMGRGVIASLMIDSRSDESQLKAKYPALWLEYNQLREEVALSSSSEFTKRERLDSQVVAEASQAATSRRHKLFNRLEEAEVEIRKRPGFERFHLAPTENEILSLACNGHLVSFNASDVSKEAFLITKDRIEVINLPNLKVEDVKFCVNLLASRGNINRRDASLIQGVGNEKSRDQLTGSETMLQLQSLWNNAVKPVLNKLGLWKEERPAGRLPRVWWVGGGLMALLPIHAAGDHSTGSRENTLSHVVSSYIPTLKSLQFAQSKKWRSFKEQGHKILIVSMPTTPGFQSHLNVGAEVKAIRDEFGSHGSVTALEQPSKADVLDQLSTCSVAHFACHGSADPIEPVKSSLLLGRVAREDLTIGDLDSVKHSLAQIAYLSACSTAEGKVHNLLDESIHLASTFQLIGFQHVIGTLWGADDSAAVEVARQFYKHLLQGDENGSMSVAYALHNAVLRFRNTGSNSKDISKWGPFIHIGS